MEELIKRINEEINKAWSDKHYNVNNLAIRFGIAKGLKIAKEIIQSSQSDGWIPCEVRLPEEKINPVTQDYYEYECTADFGMTREIRYYKFGDGHWRLSGACMDKYVLAWRELPAPYNPQKETK